MDLGLTAEQQIFKESVNSFISKSFSTGLVREMLKGQTEFPSELWKKMSELGWLGVSIPEEYGGSGLGFVELVILFEEMGKACYISPIISQILSGLLILRAGNKKQKESYLGKLIEGETTFSLALNEPGFYYHENGIKVKAVRINDKYIIEGLKLFVSGGQRVDYFICLARTSEKGTTLFILKSENPRIKLSRLKTISGDVQFEVNFDKVEVSQEDILGEVDNGWYYVKEINSKAALLKSAEMLGGSQKALDLCVEYIKIREQFGQVLGSFQAVQHKCAEMLTDVDLSRDIVYKPAWKIDQGLEYEQDIAMAKAWTSDAYRRVVQTAHQLFGAIGFCEEHDLFLYLRHAKSCEVNYGDSHFQREVIADHLFD